MRSTDITNQEIEIVGTPQPDMTKPTIETSTDLTLMGKSFNGFQIHEEVGRGGMAIVYRATQPTLNRSVAIKVLRPDFVQLNPHFITRFQQEAEAIARLSHPYILPVYDYGEADGHYYIAMQYVPDGLTLRAYMSSGMSWGMPSESVDNDSTQILSLTLQIADALTHAHQHNVIHCDLKPSNILIHDGNPLLADFGLAILDQSKQSDSSTDLMGTPAYMAPEQLQQQPVDVRTDIYTLSLILYQSLTGVLPHNAASPDEIAIQRKTLPQPPSLFRPDLAAAIDQVILKALSVNPADRYQQMADFATAIRSLIQDKSDPNTLLQQPSDFPVADESTVLSPPSLTPFQAPFEPLHFVGRTETRAQIQQTIATERGKHIFGLVGLGGSGKTSLATQLVYGVKEYFPDGVLWAQLDVTNPSAALISFGNSFGQRERVAESPDLATKATAVRHILANKRILVVLDNVEESDQLEHLLPTGLQNVSIITTRNRKLLTAIGATIIDVNPLTQASSIELLERILGAGRVQAEQDAANQVIDLVGGLPLALDIVAGYLAEADDLTIAEYKNALQDERLRLESLADWEDTSKDVIASFELSYRKLPPPLQQLFASLSIFVGHNFSTETISKITKMPLPAVKSALGRMRSLSLLTSHSPGQKEWAGYGPTPKLTAGRYGLHPLLRLFAQDKFTSDVDLLKRQAADYFAHFAHDHSHDDYALLAQDLENILGALKWAAKHEAYEIFYRGVLALTEPNVGVMGILDAHGHWHDARELLQLALSSITDATDPILQCKLFIRAGVFALREGDHTISTQYFEAALALLDNGKFPLFKTNNLPDAIDLARNRTYLYQSMARIAGREDRATGLRWLTQGIQYLEQTATDELAPERGYLHIQLASALGRLGKLDEAHEAATAGLALLPSTPNPAQVGGLINLARVASLRGDTELCVAYIEEGIVLAETLGDIRRLALLWMNLGAEQEQSGQYQQAKNSYHRALQLCEKMGHEDEGYIHSNLGLTYTILGEDDLAHQHLTTAIKFATTEDMPELSAYAKSNLARLQLYQNEVDAASANLSDSFELCQTLELTEQLVGVLRMQAEISALTGDKRRALTLVEQSIQAALELNYELEAGISWREKGNIQCALKLHKDALDSYKRSLTLIAQADPYEQARTQTELARCMFQQEPTSVLPIKTLLNEALATFERLDTRREMILIEALLNQID